MASQAALFLDPKGSKRRAQSTGNSPASLSPACDLLPMDPVAMPCVSCPGEPRTWTFSETASPVFPVPCSSDSSASSQANAMDREELLDSAGAIHLNTEMDNRPMSADMVDPDVSCVSSATQIDNSIKSGEIVAPAESSAPCDLHPIGLSCFSSPNEASTITSPQPDPMALGSPDFPGSLSEGTGKHRVNGSSPAPPMAPAGTVTISRLHQPHLRASPNVSPETSTPALNSGPNVQFTTIHDESDESDTKRSFCEISDDDKDNVHRPNLIENVYDVEARKHQLTKKVKTEHDFEQKSNTPKASISISGDSGLGKWMKAEDGKTTPTSTATAPIPEDSGLCNRVKEEGGKATSIATASAVIDLTADIGHTPKEDDEVLCTGSTDLGAQRVCFGKVDDAMIIAHTVPKPGACVSNDFSHNWPSIKLDLQRQRVEGNFRIDVADPHGRVFGTVDPKTARALCPLLDSGIATMEVTGVLDTRKAAPNEVIWGPTSGIWRASLNLYGQRKHGEGVGNFLAHRNIWLGTPNFVDKGVTVFNPHAERRRQLAADLERPQPGPSIRYESRTAEEANDAVMKMFDQLANVNIPTMEPSSHITTPLLHHQKQALWFMTEKEKPRKFGWKEKDNNSLWRMVRTPSGKIQYREIISGLIQEHKPEEALGGLLADMMGLGKTLSILSLITASLKLAGEWTEMAPNPILVRQIPGIRNTRTTLLVVPLSAVSNWVTQIKDHLKPRSMTYYVFHGPNRTTDFMELSEYDIIITTYSTILSEISGRGAKSGKLSPLTRMNMFRIVLDEAHVIREQNAAQTKAILGLHSERRWSVTGTPIQNRMEDLLSVTRFLRITPYDQRAQFSQHVYNPVKNGDPNALTRLRVLVDSFTLRRVKDKINLPPREDNIVTLPFSDQEQQVHDFFRAESHVMMNVIAGEDKRKISGRMYHHVLKAMMILRQVSAHGKELLDITDRERIKGLSAHDAIDLEDSEPDETPAVIDKKAYELFSLMQQNSVPRCGNCNRVLGEQTNTMGANHRDSPMAIFLPCHDVFCPDCFSGWKHAYDSGFETQTRCPRCEGWNPPKYSTITPAGFEEYEAQMERDRQTRRLGKNLGEYEGPHTKTIALIDYLKQSVEDSKRLVGQSPIKSIVFSAWTSHLDLIEIALHSNGLDGFTRLDGTMTLAARTKALEEFAKNDNITVLLATIGAGGVGLNLTSASRVFIMEPQYNPAAVAQAIDRVHRLGQTRDVQVFQFIMKNSIEEKIMELAKKKQEMADTSLNRGKQNKRETDEARMREYRSLFK
ncbi:Helicase C-terminal [Penicillium paradoxum]|uniref:Helicase C-terminal n=1 Tax=Penicillium paradoxum TaxID=176176 RepID=UPI002548EC6A|nr:Helicase C-terminal [Penicillium paradoxum]KAJ5773382.1 Helicase C-terminal [Penicillium paradoxum]